MSRNIYCRLHCYFQVFGGLLMGCINGKQLLNEEDLNYIARNTAMDKDAVEVRTFLGLLRTTVNLLVILQRQYQNFLKKHPDGQISRKSFHAMMKECYPGTDTEKLERHIFRMYDTNKVCHILSTVEMAVLCILRPMNLFFFCFRTATSILENL